MLCPWQSHPSSIGMLHFCEQQTRRIEEDVFWITPFIYYVQYNTYDTTLQLLIIIMFKTHFLQTHMLYLSRSVNPFSLTDLASQLSSSISRRTTKKKSFFKIIIIILLIRLLLSFLSSQLLSVGGMAVWYKKNKK